MFKWSLVYPQITVWRLAHHDAATFHPPVYLCTRGGDLVMLVDVS